MSPKHNVFVLDKEGNPLTPTTNTKARKLMKGKQAEPIWNKFGYMGIKMLVETRKETPKTALGVDLGTKFEGYVVVVGKENNLAVHWKLPDKYKIVKKIKERSQLRRSRRWRKCRRGLKKKHIMWKKGSIAPSQKVMIQSKLKAITEFFKCYPIDAVALEDIRFIHKYQWWGKDFSTVELGKYIIFDWIKKKAVLKLRKGSQTASCRTKYGYKKSSDKSAEVFNSHCSDALAIATDIYAQQHIEQGKFIVVDDRYRPIRRKLYKLQFDKWHIRRPYSTGNFLGVRKGTICEYGQICGGFGNHYSIYPYKLREGNEKRIRRVNISWFSHKFKSIEVGY